MSGTLTSQTKQTDNKVNELAKAPGSSIKKIIKFPDYLNSPDSENVSLSDVLNITHSPLTPAPIQLISGNVEIDTILELENNANRVSKLWNAPETISVSKYADAYNETFKALGVVNILSTVTEGGGYSGYVTANVPISDIAKLSIRRLNGPDVTYTTAANGKGYYNYVEVPRDIEKLNYNTAKVTFPASDHGAYIIGMNTSKNAPNPLRISQTYLGNILPSQNYKAVYVNDQSQGFVPGTDNNSQFTFPIVNTLSRTAEYSAHAAAFFSDGTVTDTETGYKTKVRDGAALTDLDNVGAVYNYDNDEDIFEAPCFVDTDGVRRYAIFNDPAGYNGNSVIYVAFGTYQIADEISLVFPKITLHGETLTEVFDPGRNMWNQLPITVTNGKLIEKVKWATIDPSSVNRKAEGHPKVFVARDTRGSLFLTAMDTGVPKGKKFYIPAWSDMYMIKLATGSYPVGCTYKVTTGSLSMDTGILTQNGFVTATTGNVYRLNNTGCYAIFDYDVLIFKAPDTWQGQYQKLQSFLCHCASRSGQYLGSDFEFYYDTETAVNYRLNSYSDGTSSWDGMYYPNVSVNPVNGATTVTITIGGTQVYTGSISSLTDFHYETKGAMKITTDKDVYVTYYSWCNMNRAIDFDFRGRDAVHPYPSSNKSTPSGVYVYNLPDDGELGETYGTIAPIAMNGGTMQMPVAIWERVFDITGVTSINELHFALFDLSSRRNLSDTKYHTSPIAAKITFSTTTDFSGSTEVTLSTSNYFPSYQAGDIVVDFPSIPAGSNYMRLRFVIDQGWMLSNILIYK